ncbi:MAG: bifunctional 4-hydroxy-2-oxoglutarate aldolase/2-dehydro-3-deoxy-phosphogluconate aldolase [Candidatus Omnitrophica bacterium]|nr:bifunctional 4-hydroxy-2-oxoglutarate aldolase/2-dehydro-3-deoxy-phosphogluconate aldolase [Candidatus Omnitrophota bacterium]
MAAVVLGEIGSSQALGALEGILNDTDTEAGLEADSILAYSKLSQRLLFNDDSMGVTVKRLVITLENGALQLSLREAAAEVLGFCGAHDVFHDSGGPVIRRQDIVRVLISKGLAEDSLRETIGESLSRIGEPARADLENILYDSETPTPTRAWAKEILNRLNRARKDKLESENRPLAVARLAEGTPNRSNDAARLAEETFVIKGVQIRVIVNNVSQSDSARENGNRWYQIRVMIDERLIYRQIHQLPARIQGRGSPIVQFLRSDPRTESNVLTEIVQLLKKNGSATAPSIINTLESTKQSVTTRALEEIRKKGKMAVIAVPSVEDALSAAEYAIKNGFIPEITFGEDDDKVLATISALRKAHPNLLTIAAGSVKNDYQAATAVRAGASILVSPGLNKDVIRQAEREGVLAIPGVGNAEEAGQAVRLLGEGAVIEYVFTPPASGLEGVLEGVKKIHRKYPNLRIILTGEIKKSAVPSLLRSGMNIIAAGMSVKAPARLASEPSTGFANPQLVEKMEEGARASLGPSEQLLAGSASTASAASVAPRAGAARSFWTWILRLVQGTLLYFMGYVDEESVRDIEAKLAQQPNGNNPTRGAGARLSAIEAMTLEQVIAAEERLKGDAEEIYILMVGILSPDPDAEGARGFASRVNLFKEKLNWGGDDRSFRYYLLALSLARPRWGHGAYTPMATPFSDGLTVSQRVIEHWTLLQDPSANQNRFTYHLLRNKRAIVQYLISEIEQEDLDESEDLTPFISQNNEFRSLLVEEMSDRIKALQEEVKNGQAAVQEANKEIRFDTGENKGSFRKEIAGYFSAYHDAKERLHRAQESLEPLEDYQTKTGLLYKISISESPGVTIDVHVRNVKKRGVETVYSFIPQSESRVGDQNWREVLKALSRDHELGLNKEALRVIPAPKHDINSIRQAILLALSLPAGTMTEDISQSAILRQSTAPARLAGRVREGVRAGSGTFGGSRYFEGNVGVAPAEPDPVADPTLVRFAAPARLAGRARERGGRRSVDSRRNTGAISAPAALEFTPEEQKNLKILTVALYDAQKTDFLAQKLLPIQLRKLLIAQPRADSQGLSLVLNDLSGGSKIIIAVSGEEIDLIRRQSGPIEFRAQAVQGVLSAMEISHNGIIDSLNTVSNNAPAHIAFPVTALNLLSGEDLEIEAELTVRRWAEHRKARYGRNVTFSWYGSLDNQRQAVLERIIQPYSDFIRLIDAPERGSLVFVDTEEKNPPILSDGIATLPTGKVQVGYAGNAHGLASVGIVTARSLPRNEKTGQIDLKNYAAAQVTEQNLAIYNLFTEEEPVSPEEYSDIITHRASQQVMFRYRLQGYIPRPVDLGARLALLRIARMAA